MSEEQKNASRIGFALEMTVFVCGALVMIYEIVGSRIVAPFIGSSTYVWTSLIGVILAALSLGYWLGGRLADRKPEIVILAVSLFFAAGLIAVTILLRDLILTAIASLPVGLEIKSVFAAVLLFAPASVALGFVVPYAVKLRMASLEDSGKTVGRLYALSTIGSIVGTFAAGFLLIPFVGSVRTLYVVAATLLALSLFLAPIALTRTNITILSLFVFAIVGSEFFAYYLRSSKGLEDIDTQYSRIRVFPTDHPRTGRPMMALATDPYSVQSAKYLDGDDLALEYTRFYHLLRHYRPDFQTALMIGGAGYSFPKDYIKSYPNAEIDVVEIDPQITQIARRFFELKDDPRMKIIHEDGRVYLNRAESGKYDAVLMDAFGSLLSVPQHLTTVEAVGQIHRVLKDDGVAIFNLGSAIKGPASYFFQAEFATYRKVFPQVLVFKVRKEEPDEKLQNLIFVACKSECRSEVLSDDSFIASLLSHCYDAEFPIELPVLTDDLAPVEYYNSIAR